MITPTPQPPVRDTSLYESAPRIHPRMAYGRWSSLRNLATIVLLGIFYGLPWLQIDGQPALLLDLPHRRFHIFGLTLFPQDLFLLAWLLLTAALTLFLFTTLAGRVWCGYACPQTVWTQAFVWIERWIEGERHQRIKLDQAPWTTSKLLIRGSKHLAWLLFSLWTGLSFVAYFVPASDLLARLGNLELGGWALFWSLFYAFATWGNAGFMREQVCKYMCPYARFQSAMFDQDTLIISYDEKRGEPRKSAAKMQPKNAGDCIDCTLCVQVCPTGIDIRKGLQYECIACAACVDACDTVMDQVGKPRGLVRYSSARQDAGGATRLLRPRLIGYAALWLLLCAGLLLMVLNRHPLELDVLRDRSQLYRELSDGSIANVFTLKLANKSAVAVELQISAQFADGQPLALSASSVTVPATGNTQLTVSAQVPAAQVHGVAKFHFRVQSAQNPELLREQEAHFFGPAR